MIEVSHLTKSFTQYEKESGLMGLLKGFFNAKKKTITAVDDVSFTINEGEIVGYIGANGAGKSTTMKMLTGILTPTHGEVCVNGIIPHKDRVKNALNIGVVFGQRTQLWWDLPLGESFTILKEIYLINDLDYQQKMKELNDILDLNEFIKAPVRTLSLGQRMRADIAASLLHNPKILYLDEPTIGLDVNAKLKMRQAIKQMNEKFKTTVILTTHDLDDIEELCSRILVIDQGRLIYDGDLATIKEKYGSTLNLHFQLKEEINSIEEIKSRLEFEADVVLKLTDLGLTLEFDKRLHKVGTLTHKVMSHFEVLDMSISETSIEKIVGDIYREGKV